MYTYGKNLKNILARKAKVFGIIDRIMKMLADLFFGPYELEVALMWRNSLFLNSILTNSEAWYAQTLQDTNHLEQIDESLIRQFLEAPFSTNKCMLYL